MNNFIKLTVLCLIFMGSLITLSTNAWSDTPNCKDPRVNKEIVYNGVPVCICNQGSQGCGGITEKGCPKGLVRADNLVSTVGSNIVHAVPGLAPTGKICIYSKRPHAYYAMVITALTCNPGTAETTISNVKYCCPKTDTNGSLCCTKIN